VLVLVLVLVLRLVLRLVLLLPPLHGFLDNFHQEKHNLRPLPFEPMMRP
jgi:hypothetical protein